MLGNKLSLSKITLSLIILFFLIITLSITAYTFKKFSLKKASNSCPFIVTDIDRNIYRTVQIGSQCWMKENLKVTNNPEGKPITRYCYNNDPKICSTDGGLYDWNTTMNNSRKEGSQGICPNGWHVPKDSEWYVLENGLAVSSCDNNRYGWSCDPSGTKLKKGGPSGFEGVFTGYYATRTRAPMDLFHDRGELTVFWSSTENKSDNAWNRNLNLPNSTVGRGADDKNVGLSIRCLMD